MAKTILFFLFSVTTLTTIYAFKNVTYNEINTKEVRYVEQFTLLTQSVVQIAKKYLFFKTAIVIHHANRITITPLENKLLDAIVYGLNINNIPLTTTDELRTKISGECDGSLLCISIIGDCTALEKLTMDSEKPKHFKFILCGDIKTRNETLEMGNKIITNKIALLFIDEAGNFSIMYAKLEMDDKTCNTTYLVEFMDVNTFITRSLKNGELMFPITYLWNFKMCPVNSGVATLHPYMAIKNKQRKYQTFDTITESDISGSDVEIIKIISRYFNATLNLYFIYRDEKNPFAEREFIDLVHNGSLDICAGGLYRIYGDTVVYSGVYTRQAVVWVYTVERDIRSWLSFVVKVNGLYLFFIFYIVYAVVWKILCKFDRQAVSIKDTLLYSLGALLGCTSLQDARTVKQKIVNVMYLIMSLHLSAYISVQLYSYLTIQGPPRLFKTIDDLISSGTKPYLRFTSKYFIQDKKYETFANTSGSCDHFLDCEKVILKKKGTTLLIDGFLPEFQAETAIGDEARVVQVNEEILFVYHEMVMRKNSYFSEPFRKAILRLFEAGICQKLYDDAIGIINVDKAYIANKNIMSNSYSCQSGCAITMTQSAGAFYIWIFGCGLSCVVFCLEVLMKREITT